LNWIFFAILSTIISGVSLVFAKKGMHTANENIALLIRTTILFLVVFLHTIIAEGKQLYKPIDRSAILWFVLAGATTAIYWIFFFKAMRTAPISILSTIDKGSIIITIIASYYLLQEPLSPRLLIGGTLIIAGTIILVYK
jgi:transporter family protein